MPTAEHEPPSPEPARAEGRTTQRFALVAVIIAAALAVCTGLFLAVGRSEPPRGDVQPPTLAVSTTTCPPFTSSTAPGAPPPDAAAQVDKPTRTRRAGVASEVSGTVTLDPRSYHVTSLQILVLSSSSKGVSSEPMARSEYLVSVDVPISNGRMPFRITLPATPAGTYQLAAYVHGTPSCDMPGSGAEMVDVQPLQAVMIR